MARPECRSTKFIEITLLFKLSNLETGDNCILVPSSTLLCFFRDFPLSPGMAFGGFDALGVSSDEILNNFIL